jgi:preprotein translocase subunit YajC
LKGEKMFLSLTRRIVRVAALLSFAVLPVLAQAQGDAPAGGEAPPGMFGGNFLFIMIAMFAIIYFVMIRPEQKKQKERQKMLSALKKGDKILTVGGVIGVIVNVKDSSYVIKSGEGAVIEFSKSAVQSLLTGDGTAAQTAAQTTAAQDSGGKDK